LVIEPASPRSETIEIIRLLKVVRMLSLTVVINKLDQVCSEETKFNDLKTEWTNYIQQIGIPKVTFIPVSGIPFPPSFADFHQPNMEPT